MTGYARWATVTAAKTLSLHDIETLSICDTSTKKEDRSRF